MNADTIQVMAPGSHQVMTGDTEGMPAVLAPEERRRISVRLGAGLVGIGLLGLGTLLVRLEPDQWQIGELCRGLAAAVVGVPTLVSGLQGIMTGDTRRATDQLVAIAVLAAAATGDFVTATGEPIPAPGRERAEQPEPAAAVERTVVVTAPEAVEAPTVEELPVLVESAGDENGAAVDEVPDEEEDDIAAVVPGQVASDAKVEKLTPKRAATRRKTPAAKKPATAPRVVKKPVKKPGVDIPAEEPEEEEE